MADKGSMCITKLTLKIATGMTAVQFGIGRNAVQTHVYHSIRVVS